MDYLVQNIPSLEVKFLRLLEQTCIFIDIITKAAKAVFSATCLPKIYKSCLCLRVFLDYSGHQTPYC